MSTRTFVGELTDAMTKNMAEDGTQINKVVVDFTTGPMRQTDRTLDFAIEGKGFFVVNKDDKTYYTRNGAFAINAEGTLVTSSGMAVGGDVNIPSNTVLENLSVGSDGTVYDGKKALGTIEMVSFEDSQKLVRAGPTLFTAPASVSPESPAVDSKMENRMLESSNTAVVSEMVEMITCMRNFEACQKMLQIQDTLEGTMISKMST